MIIITWTFGHRNELQHDKTNRMTCVPSKDSSLSAWKKPWVFSYPLSTLWRPWSDWVDAQADLSLRWVHRPYCWVLSCCGLNFLKYLSHCKGSKNASPLQAAHSIFEHFPLNQNKTVKITSTCQTERIFCPRTTVTISHQARNIREKKYIRA